MTPKPYMLRVRMEPDDKNRLDELAAFEGKSASEIVRATVEAEWISKCGPAAVVRLLPLCSMRDVVTMMRNWHGIKMTEKQAEARLRAHPWVTETKHGFKASKFPEGFGPPK